MDSRRNARLMAHQWRWVASSAVAVAAMAAIALAASPASANVPATANQTKFAAYNGCQYVVQPGDWLSKIAARYGMTWQRLAAINHLSNPNLIHPGQVLNVCGSTSSSGGSNSSSSSGSGSSSGAYVAGEFCHSTVYFTGSISQWKIPPGCYAPIYYPNPSHYVYRSGFGWCSWWPEVLHPNDPYILHNTRYSAPRAGAVAVIPPGDQGAGPVGHYAEVVAVLPGGWLLISEMNDYWRGGGFGRVNYRYIRNDGWIKYIYN